MVLRRGFEYSEAVKFASFAEEKWCLLLNHMRTHFSKGSMVEGIPGPLPTVGIADDSEN